MNGFVNSVHSFWLMLYELKDEECLMIDLCDYILINTFAEQVIDE